MLCKPRKVAIIGTGHVGAHCAIALATHGVADELYLCDVDVDKAIAEARDVNDAVSYLPHRVVATAGPIEDIKDCDALIVSAGPLPETNQDRLQTLGETLEIMDDIIPRLKKSGFDGFIVSISNPADVIAGYLRFALNYPRHKIVSTGTTLDSARLQQLLADLYNISQRSIQAYVLGEHGGSAMVPWSQVRIGNKSLTELQEEMPERFPAFDRVQMVKDMKYGGYLLLEGKGSTEFGVSTAATEVLRAFFHNEHKVLPVSTLLEGQYGQTDIFTSVPAIVGANGVEEIFEYRMTPEEKAEFDASCDVIRKHTMESIEKYKKNNGLA